MYDMTECFNCISWIQFPNEIRIMDRLDDDDSGLCDLSLGAQFYILY